MTRVLGFLITLALPGLPNVELCCPIPGRYKKEKAVGLERGPLSLVSATEEPPGSNTSGSGIEIREYGRRDSSRWPRGTLYPQKVGTNFADKRR
jgi:hypothetical protein